MEYEEPFFMQIMPDLSIITTILLFFLLALCINEGIKNRKALIYQSALIMLLTAIFLHGIIGFGINNIILYSPLYIWAFAVLISNFIRKNIVL